MWRLGFCLVAENPFRGSCTNQYLSLNVVAPMYPRQCYLCGSAVWILGSGSQSEPFRGVEWKRLLSAMSCLQFEVANNSETLYECISYIIYQCIMKLYWIKSKLILQITTLILEAMGHPWAAFSQPAIQACKSSVAWSSARVRSPGNRNGLLPVPQLRAPRKGGK